MDQIPRARITTDATVAPRNIPARVVDGYGTSPAVLGHDATQTSQISALTACTPTHSVHQTYSWVAMIHTKYAEKQRPRRERRNGKRCQRRPARFGMPTPANHTTSAPK